MTSYVMKQSKVLLQELMNAETFSHYSSFIWIIYYLSKPQIQKKDYVKSPNNYPKVYSLLKLKSFLMSA